jgi:molybdopterin-guanine dinucleotide biosynthesis protein A
VAIPFDGERLHPVFLVLKTHLKDSLESYLASGERKVELWLKAQPYITVDFSDEAAIFCNINTLTELSALETRYADQP